MAVPEPNTLTTAIAVGTAESLADLIAKVDPMDTPLYSNSAKTSARAVLHEWQKWIPKPLAGTASQDLSGVWALLAAFAVDDLITHNGVVYQCIQTIGSATATMEPGVGLTWPDFWTTSISELTPLYRAEGENPDRGAVISVPVRLTNPTSIFWQDYMVSGTLQAVDLAGRQNELAWQQITQGMTVRRDVEQAFLMNYPKQAADPRILAGLPTWAGGADGTTVSAATGAHTPAALETAMALLIAKGVVGDTVLMSPANHATFAATVRTAAAKDIESAITEREVGTWAGAVSIYLTDNGPVQIVQDRYIDTTGGYSYVFDKEHIRVAQVPGRAFKDTVLAATGDAHQRMCIWEGSLEITAPDAIEILV